MADEGNESSTAILVGVLLVSDTNPLHSHCLGCLILKPSSKTESLSSLRCQLAEQIANLPSSFIFLTSHSWPVQKSQEDMLLMSHVISHEGCILIRKNYDKPKIGIRAKTGMCLGFVFADYKTSLIDFRLVINNELSFFHGIPNTYVYMDANGWPVGQSLERDWTILDILNDGCVAVCADTLSLEYQNGGHMSVDFQPPRKKLKGLRELSYRTTKDTDRQSSVDASDTVDGSMTSKQLLISYVRAEAADHALILKEELSLLGFSVYLDVHEIKSGVDWQDSLNYAVSNCQVFVPIVTPRYGETQWTNREVKLADVLGKFILPISFLDTWPPHCLAIQFATTQYICWKTAVQIQTEEALGNGSKVKDIQIWDRCYVERTAIEIGERFKQLRKDMIGRVPSLFRRKTLMKTFAGKLPDGLISLDESVVEGKPLVVICVHPTQAAFGEDVRCLLEREDLSVWCSSGGGRGTTDLETDMFPFSQDLLDSQSQEIDKNMVGISPNNQTFQEYADRAAVVIVILSQAFSRSRTCQEQVFYCEHRKRVIPVKYEDFCMPGWMSMLIGTNTFEAVQQEGYRQRLVTRVKQCSDPSSRDNLVQEISEVKLTHFVKHIRNRVGQSSCVYISGGTKFYNNATENICRCIGRELAQLTDIAVASGGFYGVGETVSRTFYEESQRLWRKNKVWHVLPEKDEQDKRQQANQNADSTFNAVSFGKTIFCGESVREREIIVSRAFDICILIEGGPGAAHETEQFVWNDHTVIPIRQTGGAAGGKFNVPNKIFQIPNGVSEYDWKILGESGSSPEEIGQSVSRIVQTLLKRMTNEELASSQGTPTKANQMVRTPPPLKLLSPARTKTTLTSMKTILLQ